MTDSYKSCRLCPHQCKANRTGPERGRCGAGSSPVIYRYAPHHGEEPPVSGKNGSGTIFFSHCTLSCIHCQNYPWSQQHKGKTYNPRELSGVLTELAAKGCHNWNLVSPTPWLPDIYKAVSSVKETGIHLPIVYNTSGFERKETLAAFSELMDIALVDLRYAVPSTAAEACGSAEYVEAARETLRFFWQKLGPLQVDKQAIACKGVICRILVLPGHADEACRNIEWIAENLGTDMSMSLMSQYTPVYKALTRSPWNRRLNRSEYNKAINSVHSLGFENGWIQDFQKAPSEGMLGCEMHPE